MTDLEKNMELLREDVNLVHIRGTIVHKYVPAGKNIVILTISSATLGREIPNYPKITFKGELKACAESFPLYSNIDVTARLQSVRLISPNGEKKYRQSLVGTSICESKRTLSEAFGGISGGSYLEPVNQVKLAGEIVSSYKSSDNVVSCTLKTVTGENTSFNKTSVYCRNADEWIQNHPTGIRIAALGEVQTIKKEKDNDTVFYENIVLKEIQKIS